MFGASAEATGGTQNARRQEQRVQLMLELMQVLMMLELAHRALLKTVNVGAGGCG